MVTYLFYQKIVWKSMIYLVSSTFIAHLIPSTAAVIIPPAYPAPSPQGYKPWTFAASYTLLREQLEEVMNTLTPREAKVLKLRFGLEDGKARTLEEVGKEFDVTRERIRQIEAKALRKLRHPSRSKKLRDYMN